MSRNKSDSSTRRDFIGQASAALAAATVFGASTSSAATPPPTTNDEDANKPKAQRLLGKAAVVTGAARGIGRAIAVALAKEGADVMGIDIAGPVSPVLEVTPASRDELAETAKLVEQLGRRFISVVADVRDLGALVRAAEEGEKQFGHIDIVVGNAGIQVFKPLLEMNRNHWQDILDVNLTGYYNTIRAFAPAMVNRKKGRIILVGSSQGRQGTKHAASYSASKWGVIGLMKSAALELGEHKITVNCVIPGLVDTPLTRNPARWREAMAEDVKNPPANPTEQQVAEVSKKKYPLGIPWLQPEDIAPTVTFLATDEAGLITGANYDVTGGLSTHYDA